MQMGGEVMVILQERLAKIIRTRRIEMGLSQEQLAEKIDKSTSFIGQVERGECFPKFDTLQALVTCLGIDANELFADKPLSRDNISELFDLALHMDENKRSLLIEFARLLHKVPL